MIDNFSNLTCNRKQYLSQTSFTFREEINFLRKWKVQGNSLNQNLFSVGRKLFSASCFSDFQKKKNKSCHRKQAPTFYLAIIFCQREKVDHNAVILLEISTNIKYCFLYISKERNKKVFQLYFSDMDQYFVYFKFVTWLHCLNKVLK